MMLKDYIKNFNIGILYENYSLKNKTSIKIGGVCRYYLEVYNEEKLILLIKYLRNDDIPYYIIGNCTNLLIDDDYLNLLIISLVKLNEIIKITNNAYLLSSGVKPIKLGVELIKEGYIDALLFVLIPGSIGGLTFMNARCFKKSMSDIVYKVVGINKSGERVVVDKYTKYVKELIITKVLIRFKSKNNNAFNILESFKNKKKITQPLNSYNMGSIFINPPNVYSWELIDRCGLRGFSINDAIISIKHPNFIINKNNAKFNEVLALIYYTKYKVKEKTGITLEKEIKILTSRTKAY